MRTRALRLMWQPLMSMSYPGFIIPITLSLPASSGLLAQKGVGVWQGAELLTAQ